MIKNKRMGKVQEYLEKKRIEKEGLPKMWIVHSTMEGVKEPVERQVVHTVYGVDNIKYELDKKSYPYEIVIPHSSTSYTDYGFGSGFGDTWAWTYFSSLSKKEATEWFEKETLRIRYKYFPEQKKTEKIFELVDDATHKFELIGEYDYIDYLQFRLKLLENGYKGGYYIHNEHGGYDEIDRFACNVGYDPFTSINKILYKIISLQCDLRKKEFELEEKENGKE